MSDAELMCQMMLKLLSPNDVETSVSCSPWSFSYKWYAFTSSSLLVYMHGFRGSTIIFC